MERPIQRSKKGVDGIKPSERIIRDLFSLDDEDAVAVSTDDDLAMTYVEKDNEKLPMSFREKLVAGRFYRVVIEQVEPLRKNWPWR